MPFKKLNSILVKPAGPDCNLSCTYCFYKDKFDSRDAGIKHRMSDEILEELLKQAMIQSDEYISIAWQGGEPTLMGLPFFKRAINFIERYGTGKSVGNAIQTNGILVDQDWIGFLKKFHFLVGISIDGPEHIHDFYRRSKSGKGSWAIVKDNTMRMLDQGVQVNALTVLNDYSVQFPEEIYEFDKDIGLNHMQFIPCVEYLNKSKSKIAKFSIDSQAYGKFLCTLFDLWRSDFKDGVPATVIRFFESVFRVYVGMDSSICSFLKECGTYIVIEHNGDVYCCDFYVETRWRLGNIKEHSLVDLLNSETQATFRTMKIDRMAECNRCKWLEMCYGGCTKTQVQNSNGGYENYFCESYKLFFEYSSKEYQKLAAIWKDHHKGELT
jgi:uncharacterized protein